MAKVEERFAGSTGLIYDDVEVIFDEQSDFQRVQWFRSPTYGMLLLLDGFMMTNELDEHFYHESLVHPAATRAAALNDVLIIGGGDGGTARELLRYGCNVTQVEIDGMVVDTSRKFMPQTACSYDDPRMEIIVDDAARWIQETDRTFDLIIMDSAEPDEGTNIPLFEPEFFARIDEILKPEGLYALQVGGAIFHEDIVHEVTLRLKRQFPTSVFYAGPTPTYPGGTWIYGLHAKTSTLPSQQRPLADGLKWLKDPDTLLATAGMTWPQKIG